MAETRSADPYNTLAAALGALPNGFPRTAAGKELLILQKIFTPEEASLASHLTGEMELPAAIAARTGLDAGEVASRLKAMARQGKVWLKMDDEARTWRFRLAPFIVGIYEAAREIMDHELAHLVEDYMFEGGAAGIMGPEPALHRVVPGRHSVAAEWVLPYEDVARLLDGARSFTTVDCVCRLQQERLGTRKCDAPLHNCLTFSPRPPGPGSMSKEEALALLDESERVGLVHTVSNVVRDVYYVCNCCGCCCGILRGVNEHGLPGSVAKASYVAEVDAELCSSCGVCVDRCQVHAIAMDGGAIAVVDSERCIGCGLCVSGCSTGATALRKRPDWEAIHPPESFADWEHERLHAREVHTR
ncbi:MAG TPA: 4Fe-4S binding protein [Chloroflexota bacterium]